MKNKNQDDMLDKKNRTKDAAQSSAPQPTDSPADPARSAATPASEPRLTELEQALAERTADLQRTRADFENYRKQVELQRSQAVSAAREDTVRAILPLLDQLQLAIANYHSELAPLEKSFTKTIQDFQLQTIDSRPDTEFNPELHEAVTVEGEGERELIAETLRPGYYYQGRVLRPAIVKVKCLS